MLNHNDLLSFFQCSFEPFSSGFDVQAGHGSSCMEPSMVREPRYSRHSRTKGLQASLRRHSTMMASLSATIPEIWLAGCYISRGAPDHVRLWTDACRAPRRPTVGRGRPRLVVAPRTVSIQRHNFRSRLEARSYPQFLHSRTHRSWQVDPRRPADRGHGRTAKARDEGTGSRHARSRA